ncbi:MAG: hypothetical protein IMZ64_05065 [Bacteroidetes bacterium]|nr:hypothetical protein [Bacteroidota bacterium]
MNWNKYPENKPQDNAYCLVYVKIKEEGMLDEEFICTYTWIQEKNGWYTYESGIRDDIAPNITHWIDIEKIPIPTDAEPLTCKYVEVKGKEEHRVLIQDTNKCKELGLDPYFERMVYQKQYGEWLE